MGHHGSLSVVPSDNATSLSKVREGKMQRYAKMLMPLGGTDL